MVAGRYFLTCQTTHLLNDGQGDPPKPDHLERLCAETVLTLNDAMCAYYIRPRVEVRVPPCLAPCTL